MPSREAVKNKTMTAEINLHSNGILPVISSQYFSVTSLSSSANCLKNPIYFNVLLSYMKVVPVVIKQKQKNHKTLFVMYLFQSYIVLHEVVNLNLRNSAKKKKGLVAHLK